MPAIEVYSVDFAQGNLTPSLDSKGWGDMRPGRSVTAGMTPVGDVESQPDSIGINLSAHQESPDGVSNSRYVVLPPNTLPLATRLVMRAEFDLPDRQQLPGVPSDAVFPAWAVALKVKFGGADDVAGEPGATVTCQFQEDNITVPGVRLNTPGSQQRDQADNLDTPIDYVKYRGHASTHAGGHGSSPGLPTLFTLDFSFCGVQAGPLPSTPGSIGHASGSGALSIGDKKDQRVFSTTSLSTQAQSWIGAFGVSLTSGRAKGTIKVRLRRFSVSLIAPGTPP